MCYRARENLGFLPAHMAETHVRSLYYTLSVSSVVPCGLSGNHVEALQPKPKARMYMMKLKYACISI